MTLRAIDLFCGAGGLSRGLSEAGFEIVAAADSWETSLRSYRANFPGHMALAVDASTITAESLPTETTSSRLDLIAGGPPCQGFSIQRIGHDLDDRNDLVLAFARVVSDLRPRCFLMENVPGLLGRRGRLVVQKFTRIMTNSGYDLQHAIVDAADFGVPQSRRRVFFIGWDRNTLPKFSFPLPNLDEEQRQTVRDAIRDLPPPPEDFSPSAGDALHRRIRLSTKNLERLSLIPPGGGFEDLPIEMRVECHKSGAARIGHRSVYGRLAPDRPAATITARFDSFTRGRFGHPWEERNITLREGARLQGFPDSHSFYGTQEEIAAQIGNAVPPTLAYVFGKALKEFLEGDCSSVANDVQLALPFRSERQLTVAA
jgi:DNA (cytosine-5)-methyltransferase 1